MRAGVALVEPRTAPSPAAAIELLKPLTWFAPMWAMLCGVVASGEPLAGRWRAIAGAVVLAGPLVCGTSQAVNDWFDREVDAINEPGRPIPSGRVPGVWGLVIACIWTALSLAVAAALGTWVFVAAVVGLALAWAYSAPPFRLKRNGWWGNSAVGLCYEGIPWFTGVAATAGALPGARNLVLAFLYSAGAFGIMVLNDFKSVEGDVRLGLRSLPVQLGVDRAARLACVVMALAQLPVPLLLWRWGSPLAAALVAGSVLLQLGLMRGLVRDPKGQAARYNATGTTLYVLGMLASACAVRAFAQGGL